MRTITRQQNNQANTILSSYFTLPESFTDTAKANGLTAFTSLATTYDLSNTFENTPDATYFIPNNNAFAIQGATGDYSSIKSLLLGHVIPDFVGYLPELTNGSTYTSLGGSKFTVTNDGCDYYVNNAKIVLANVVMGNGVAHVLDQVCWSWFGCQKHSKLMYIYVGYQTICQRRGCCVSNSEFKFDVSGQVAL